MPGTNRPLPMNFVAKMREDAGILTKRRCIRVFGARVATDIVRSL